MSEHYECPICGGADFSPVAAVSLGGWHAAGSALERRETPLPLGACETCGHVRMLYPYDDAFLAGIYGADPFVSTAEFANAGAATLAFCRDELGRAEGRMVDVGCGGGALLSALRESVAHERLLGLDFNRTLPDGLPFRACDLNALEAAGMPPEGPFGFIFCTHVLEHIVEPRPFLRALARWLRPDGHLLLEVPDFSWADPAAVHDVAMVCAQHIHYFTPDSLAALVRSCGLEIVRADPDLATRLLLRRRMDSRAAAAVRVHVDTMTARRRDIARHALDLLARDGAVGLWGIGAEFAQMRRDWPDLESALASGGIGLFDLLHAGRTVDGMELRSPAEISRHGGRVLILPANAIIRAKMRAAAEAGGWGDRVEDPWLRPLPR